MVKTRTMGPTGVLRSLPVRAKSATQLTIEKPKPVSKQRDGMITSRQGYVAAPTARATDRVGVPQSAAASPKLDMSQASLQSSGPVQLPPITVTGSRPPDEGLIYPYAEGPINPYVSPEPTPGIESEKVTATQTPDGRVTAAPTELPEGERTYYGPWSEPVTQAPIAKNGVSWPLLVGSGLALWFLLK